MTSKPENALDILLRSPGEMERSEVQARLRALGNCQRTGNLGPCEKGIGSSRN
jgi:hypothetical protein